MPETGTTLIPYICCRNADEAIAFYGKAFGAEVGGVHRMPDGRILHAAIAIDGVAVWISEEFPEHGGASPLALGGTPVTLHLQVPNSDAVFNRAVEAGCTVLMPLEDAFWGDRFGMVADPYGHQWSIATHIRDMTPEEIMEAIAAMERESAE